MHHIHWSNRIYQDLWGFTLSHYSENLICIWHSDSKLLNIFLHFYENWSSDICLTTLLYQFVEFWFAKVAWQKMTQSCFYWYLVQYNTDTGKPTSWPNSLVKIPPSKSSQLLMLNTAIKASEGVFVTKWINVF